MPINVDFSKLDKKFSDLTKQFEKEAKTVIKETGEQAIKIIVQRTRQKGQDREGRQFKPYSKGYLKQRRKSGASSRVILTSAGATVGGKKRLRGNAQGGTMLNSLTIVRTEDGGLKVVISAARKIELDKLAGHVRGEGGLPIRNPLGFTPLEDKKLTNMASRQLKQVIRKIGLSSLIKLSPTYPQSA